jgi:SAM-dependent methyltransferase
MTQNSRVINSRSAFKFKLPDVLQRGDVMYPPHEYRRSWRHNELLAYFPDARIDILDVGAGQFPFRKREADRLVTVDFDETTKADVIMDVSSGWPFGDNQFDLICMSHVLEHFYPQDRDKIINHVYDSLKPGGMLFIRVPHWSSRQATGWEHYTLYGLNGVTSLCHGCNPCIPMFRAISTGVSITDDYYGKRSIFSRLLEKLLNAYWGLTDRFLCYWIGGIAEVQFILQKMPNDMETSIRRHKTH